VLCLMFTQVLLQLPAPCICRAANLLLRYGAGAAGMGSGQCRAPGRAGLGLARAGERPAGLAAAQRGAARQQRRRRREQRADDRAGPTPPAFPGGAPGAGMSARARSPLVHALRPQQPLDVHQRRFTLVSKVCDISKYPSTGLHAKGTSKRHSDSSLYCSQQVCGR